VTGRWFVPSVLLVALAVAGLVGIGSSSGQSPVPAVGVSYGGLREEDGVWLRVDGSRTAVAALEIPIAIAGERCSDGKVFSNDKIYGGTDYYPPIYLRPDGGFTKTIVARWRAEGIRYSETATVKGKVTDARASGTYKVEVRFVKPNGRKVHCRSTIQRWSAVN
jgi:hypothetical protein